jgi:hypothetical protein
MKTKSKMAMKVLVVVTVMISVLCLTACSGDAKIPGFDVSVRPADDTGNSSDTGNDSNTNSDSSGNVSDNGSENNSSGNNNSGNNSGNNNNTTNTVNPADILMPPGVIANNSSAGSIAVTSSRSFQELYDFYQTALKNLGAKETDSSQYGSAWSYDGVYGNGKSISIRLSAVSGVGTGVNISY